MSGAFALLLGAMLVAAHGHRPLLLLTRSLVVDPQVSLVAWLVTLLSVVVTTVAGVAFLGLPGHGGLGPLLGQLNSCWAALRHGALPSWEQGSALVGAAALIAIAVRVGVVARRQTIIRRRRRERYRFLLALVGTKSAQSSTMEMVWLEHEEMVAFSVAGKPGLIVLSRGVGDQLSPQALAATIEHERAHLRGHHQFMLDIVDAVAAALPVAPLFRTAPEALRELVEAAADGTAVRRCGAGAVRNALESLTAVPQPGDGLAMAATGTARRLQRLRFGRGAQPAAVRSFWCAAISVAAAALPAVLGLGVVVSVACSVG